MAGSCDLHTERLSGRPLHAEDFDALRTIHSEPRAAATLTADGKPPSEEETRASIDRWTRHWATDGFGVWMFFRSDGDFVGYAGIMRTEVEGKSEIELLYAVRSQYWGSGYATEMSKGVTHFAFEHEGLKELVAYTLPTNTGSRRVMENCGFRYEREIVHAGLPHVLYRLTAADYAGHQA
jgi:ribosomal-protein-alanine N-acetyltransferase